jgi:hypothetical protein
MSEDLLRNLDVPGCVEDSLSQCVTKKMWMNGHTHLTGDVAQRRLERCVTESLALALARCDPECVQISRSAAFGAQVLVQQRPEIIGDGHSMFIARTLQADCDRALLAIDVIQRHAQNPVSTGECAPVTDALTGTTGQRQNCLVAPGRCRIDQLLNLRGIKASGNSLWHTSPKSIAVWSVPWQIASNHAVTGHVSKWVPGCRVDAAVPRAAAIFRVTSDAVIKIRRQHSDTVVDSPRLSGLLNTTRGYGALLASACELGNLAAETLAGHMVGISASVMQPAEEMRKPNCIRTLRVGRAIALAQFSQKLIA